MTPRVSPDNVLQPSGMRPTPECTAETVTIYLDRSPGPLADQPADLIAVGHAAGGPVQRAEAHAARSLKISANGYSQGAISE
jgi:hypothetical protein